MNMEHADTPNPSICISLSLLWLVVPTVLGTCQPAENAVTASSKQRLGDRIGECQIQSQESMFSLSVCHEDGTHIKRPRSKATLPVQDEASIAGPSAEASFGLPSVAEDTDVFGKTISSSLPALIRLYAIPAIRGAYSFKLARSWLSSVNGAAIMGALRAARVLFLSAGCVRIVHVNTEDAILDKNFGKEWREWAKKVPYWLFPDIWTRTVVENAYLWNPTVSILYYSPTMSKDKSRRAAPYG
ncbi:hypothetical protein EV401DRAFT_1889027 [Pisolithus croceorrhizus]|nr:hypothetical protein EV401DRAFT_1889027 [Pisolithus croceorrhizus]